METFWMDREKVYEKETEDLKIFIYHNIIKYENT